MSDKYEELSKKVNIFATTPEFPSGAIKDFFGHINQHFDSTIGEISPELTELYYAKSDDPLSLATPDAIMKLANDHGEWAVGVIISRVFTNTIKHYHPSKLADIRSCPEFYKFVDIYGDALLII